MDETEKQPLLDSRDFRLSMRIGRRRRDGREVHALRSLLVHRLRDGAKAVLRLPLAKSLASSAYGILCEPCNTWMQVKEMGEEFPCPQCGRVFALEFAVFSVVPGTGPQD